VAVVETISRMTPLHVAVINRHRGAVDLLLRGDAPVQARDGYGATPLDLARLDHQSGMVALLECYQHKMMGTAPRTIHPDIQEEMMADASRAQAVDHPAERDIAVTVGTRVGETTSDVR
jgi:ankyrin repeat protein